ncbi:MAG: HNH endonuclease [Candidatus Lokiarchaeia archaeon]
MSRTPDKINDEIIGKVWERDNASCQTCGKKLYNITTIDPFKEISEELHTLKDIEIYKWERKCWKCGEKTPRVSYFFNAGFDYRIGEIEKLDKILMEMYLFLSKTFSKTMEQEVIANICVHCSSLQGNWFIGEEIMLDIIYQGLDNFVDKILPNNLTLEDLALDKEDPMFQPYPDIKTFGHVHHVDGDRSNNELENLLLLCPSCHKKADIERRKANKKK